MIGKLVLIKEGSTTSQLHNTDVIYLVTGLHLNDATQNGGIMELFSARRKNDKYILAYRNDLIELEDTNENLYNR